MTDNSDLIHWETYRVRGYAVDLHKHASIPTIIQMMHDAAMEHVLELGFSAKELGPLNLGWVLIRQELEVFQQPGLGETVKVKTYPCGKDRAFTYRDFHLSSESGEILAQATTTWLLMDIETRRIARYPDFINAWLDRTMELEHLPRAGGDIPTLTNPGLEKTFHVNWHDLDFNHHLTNFYYQKWMLETVPNEVLENRRLKRYRILFKGESFLDEVLTAASQEIEPGVFVHHIRKGEQELTTGMTVWE